MKISFKPNLPIEKTSHNFFVSGTTWTEIIDLLQIAHKLNFGGVQWLWLFPYPLELRSVVGTDLAFLPVASKILIHSKIFNISFVEV